MLEIILDEQLEARIIAKIQKMDTTEIPVFDIRTNEAHKPQTKRVTITCSRAIRQLPPTDSRKTAGKPRAGRPGTGTKTHSLKHPPNSEY